MKSRAALLALALAGCADATTTIEISARGAALVAVKDDDDGFVALPLAADETYVVDVSDRFAVARICSDDGTVYALAVLAGPGDPTAFDLDCPWQQPETTPIEIVSAGGAIQASCGDVTGAGTSFVLQVSRESASCDLVAFDWTGARMVRQTVDTRSPASIRIDPSLGESLRTVPVADQAVDLFVTFVTANGTVVSRRPTPATLQVPPATMIEPGDRVYLRAGDLSAPTVSGLAFELDGAALDALIAAGGVDAVPPSVALEPTKHIRDGMPVVDFGDLEGAPRYLVGAQWRENMTRVAQYTAHFLEGWGESDRVGEIAFPDLTSAAGWDDSWALYPTFPTIWTAEARREVADARFEFVGISLVAYQDEEGARKDSSQPRRAAADGPR